MLFLNVFQHFSVYIIIFLGTFKHIFSYMPNLSFPVNISCLNNKQVSYKKPPTDVSHQQGASFLNYSHVNADKLFI